MTSRMIIRRFQGSIATFRTDSTIARLLYNVTTTRHFAMAGSSGADFISMNEDVNLERRNNNSRGEGRGRGRGGRGGGGGGPLSREVQISKGLSKLLRHAAGDAGLKLDVEGFARVDRVVRLFPFACRHGWLSLRCVAVLSCACFAEL